MIVTSRVRKADRSDAPELMAMCRELHTENGIFSMSDQKVWSYLEKAFNRQGAVIGVIGTTHLEASICMIISNFWYSEDWHVEELWNFVRPQHRKTDNAKELIAFGQRCADEIGIPLVIGVMSNERTEAKVRLYRRKLGEPSGAFFVYPHLPPATQTGLIEARRATG